MPGRCAQMVAVEMRDVQIGQRDRGLRVQRRRRGGARRAVRAEPLRPLRRRIVEVDVHLRDVHGAVRAERGDDALGEVDVVVAALGTALRLVGVDRVASGMARPPQRVERGKRAGAVHHLVRVDVLVESELRHVQLAVREHGPGGSVRDQRAGVARDDHGGFLGGIVVAGVAVRELRAGMRGEHVRQAGEELRPPRVVGVEIGDQLAARDLEAVVARLPLDRSAAAVALVVHHANARVLRRVAVHQRGGLIGRRVVDEDQLPVRERLREHAVDRETDHRGLVVRRHDDADGGLGHGARSAAAVRCWYSVECAAEVSCSGRPLL